MILFICYNSPVFPDFDYFLKFSKEKNCIHKIKILAAL